MIVKSNSVSLNLLKSPTSILKCKYQKEFMEYLKDFSKNKKAYDKQTVHKVDVTTSNYMWGDYEQIYYPASTVKKVVGGKGNMSKIEIHDIICKEYPEISFRNYDESDAFATALCFFKKNKKL